MRYLERLHPIAAFLYLTVVIVFAMLTMHPVLLLMVFLSGVILCGMLIGVRELLKTLPFSFLLGLLIALQNPLFVHRGETVLFYLSDSPVTRESIVYGAFAALMLLGVFYWCRCYSTVITSDKFIYLFGRVIPKLSLLFSMALAALPHLKRRFREVDEAQRGLGVYRNGSWFDLVRGKLRVFSVLVSLSLEDSVVTADSMRARGYGLRGRTAVSLYVFRASDALFLLLTLCLAGILFALYSMGVADFSYYPGVDSLSFSPLSNLLYLLTAGLVSLPIILEAKEGMKWRYLRSRI